MLGRICGQLKAIKLHMKQQHRHNDNKSTNDWGLKQPETYFLRSRFKIIGLRFCI